jgi:hypothetical protein
MKKRNFLLVILAVLLVFGMVVSCDDGLGDETGGGGGGNTTGGTLSKVAANGSATTTTTQLTLTFTKAVTGLTAADIELGGAAAASVTKGALTGSGTTWTLAVTVTGGGALTVKVGTATQSTTVFWVDPFKDYYQKFYATYKNSSNQNITETIDISKDTIKFTDNEVKLTDSSAAVDYLDIKVTKWEAATVPPEVNTKYPIDPNALREKAYTKAVKVTGKITGSKPPRGTINSIYGTTTCPGITANDVKADGTGTTVYFYLYFTEETNKTNLYFVKSAFFADPAKANVTVANPIEKREYIVNDQDD